MRAQEKRLRDAEHLNRSLLVRCKSVEALATELTAELQKERRELTSIMRRKEDVDSSMDASAEVNGYLQGRLASARRREQSVEEDMAALRTAVEAASSVQDTLAGDLVEAQQEQAALSSQLMRVSQDRDRLATAVSTAHIRYNKQLDSLRERLRTYEQDPAGKDASQDTLAEASNTAAELARLEAEATRLRAKLDASVLQAKQADAKFEALTAAHEQQLAAARKEAEKAKTDARTAAQNVATLCDDAAQLCAFNSSILSASFSWSVVSPVLSRSDLLLWFAGRRSCSSPMKRRWQLVLWQRSGSNLTSS